MVIEQALCWLFAFAFLALVFRFAHKERYFLATLCLIACFVAGLSSLSWFQGLIKTEIILIVKSTLKAYGDRLNDFQREMGEMRSELSDQQKQLGLQQALVVTQQGQLAIAQSNIFSQQSVMTAQVQQITNLQGELAVAQKTITDQAKKLDDVEFIAKNLFGNTRFEVISGSDSNAVAVQMVGNSGRIGIKLKEPAILRSVQATFESPGNLMIPRPLLVLSQSDNVLFANFAFGEGNMKPDLEGINFNIQYVRDTRSTNTVKKLEFREGQFFCDGMLVEFLK